MSTASSNTTAVFDLLARESKSEKSVKVTNADTNTVTSVVSMVECEPKIIGAVVRKLVEMVCTRMREPIFY